MQHRDLVALEQLEDVLVQILDQHRRVTAEVEGEAEASERTFFWNFRGGQNIGGRIGDLKLFTDGDMRPEKTEMYDLASDPYERRNLFERQPDRGKDLLDLIREEREKDDTSVRPDAPNQLGP